MGLLFKIVPHRFQDTTDIYNAKTLSIEYDDLNIDYARIDIMDESIDEINKIINTVKSGKKFSRS